MTPLGIPAVDDALLVFSQQSNARIAIDAWNDHAVRFFQTRVGMAEPFAPEGGVPGVMRARLVIAPDGGAAGVRSAWTRSRTADDLALADAAEARAGGGGLALLARRCPWVWLVERDTIDDRLALCLAAILASVLLGPVLDARAGKIFGVRTAREKLAAR